MNSHEPGDTVSGGAQGKASPVLTHHDLIVWQRSVELITAIYRVAGNLPKQELFGLSSQLRRASVSVAANIAEGRGRETTKEFLRILAIAYGSLMEVDALLHVGHHRLGLVGDQGLNECLGLASEVGRMLASLRSKLRARVRKSRPTPRRESAP